MTGSSMAFVFITGSVAPKSSILDGQFELSKYRYRTQKG